MTQILTFIETHSVLVGILSGLIPLLFPQFRRMLSRAWALLRGESQRKLVIEKLDSVMHSLGENGKKLSAIEKEMKFNGGRTIKDMLTLLFNYREHDFWKILIPSFELDGDAQLLLVSETACRLFGVASQEDLKRRSWLRFISPVMAAGVGTVDDFISAFTATVKFQSEFQIRLRITSSPGKSSGEWELRGSPISSEGASTKIYSCHLTPVDEAAKEEARGLQYGCPLICKPRV